MALFRRSIFLGVILCLSLFYTQANAFELAFEASSNNGLAHPHDITLSVDGRFLYVADNNNNRIVVLDPTSLAELGRFAEGEVRGPHDVAFQSASRLLVADTGNHRIAIYDVDGIRATPVGEYKGHFYSPEGVTVHPNGRVYVTGAGSGNIIALENGREVASYEGLSAPHDVAVAPDGSIWVADAGNDRLVNFDENLKQLKIIKGEPFNFDGPRYLDFDSKGRMYVADKYTNKIKVLAPDKRLIYTVGKKRAGLGPGVFNRPEGVVIRGIKVWFSDTYNDRIVRYRIFD